MLARFTLLHSIRLQCSKRSPLSRRPTQNATRPTTLTLCQNGRLALCSHCYGWVAVDVRQMHPAAAVLNMLWQNRDIHCEHAIMQLIQVDAFTRAGLYSRASNEGGTHAVLQSVGAGQSCKWWYIMLAWTFVPQMHGCHAMPLVCLILDRC